MKASIRKKLEGLQERFDEIAGLLAQPEVQSNQNQFRQLGQEYAQIEPVVAIFRQFIALETDIQESTELLSDPEMVELAKESIQEAKQQIEVLEPQLQRLLIPSDPKDKSNIFLEIRAGTGGAEAALFAGDLYRAYLRYAEQQGWQVENISVSDGEHGGYKEVIARIKGANVYSRMKFESGTHRVQRVPDTESQGRVHTSACTVAIMPEADEIAEIEINPAELRIDTYRASGAGGQHVNKTDSAVRITHLPTNTVVECQDERSQHKNKARALSLLKARILDAEQSAQADELAANRKMQVGSGDRSERIRTYNFPQNRLTDHRINLTLYKLDDIMQGHFDQLINPLLQEYQAEQLAALADD